ncbi:MAG: alpha/beta hydrolase [Sphingopyxis sp.]
MLAAGHPELLAHFPPSLLISATRDFAASAVSVMHRRLLAAGVEASFVLFDGLWHAHHMDVDLPESVETYKIVAGFFRKYLG